ncbi:MAG: hypothetical protein ACRD2L_12980 [Terriglobia bacterium]
MQPAQGLRVTILLLTVLKFSQTGWTQEARSEQSENKEAALEGVSYAGGQAPMPKNVTASVRVGDEALNLRWQTGQWDLPYEQIRTLYVSLSRPSALVELDAALAPLALAKKRKCYLSIRYEDVNGSHKIFYFLIARGNGRSLLDALALRSKVGVVFESEEARRAMRGK